jgi:hypothetical protein
VREETFLKCTRFGIDLASYIWLIYFLFFPRALEDFDVQLKSSSDPLLCTEALRSRISVALGALDRLENEKTFLYFIIIKKNHLLMVHFLIFSVFCALCRQPWGCLQMPATRKDGELNLNFVISQVRWCQAIPRTCLMVGCMRGPSKITMRGISRTSCHVALWNKWRFQMATNSDSRKNLRICLWYFGSSRLTYWRRSFWNC